MFNPSAMEVGRFDARTNAITAEIEPFGYFKLGRKVGTITLLSATSTAVQIVADGNGSRLNVGSTIAMNGVQCFIRNPFATPIKVQFLEDLPIQVETKQDVKDIEYSGGHQHSLSYEMGLQSINVNRGLILLPKQGSYYVHVNSSFPIDLSALPFAKPEYEPLMAVDMLTKTPKALNTFGLFNDQIIARGGVYTTQQVTDWVAATNWDFSPRLVSRGATYYEGVINSETAFLLAHRGRNQITINLKLYDLGDWVPQRSSRIK